MHHQIQPFRDWATCLLYVGVVALLTLGTSCSRTTTTQGVDNTSAPGPEVMHEEPTQGIPANEVSSLESPGPNQVLRHAVFFSFKEATPEAKIEEIVNAFRALPSKIDAITDFEWGTNNSPEDHDDGFTHCFLLTFKDTAGREEYLPHEAHKAFGSVLGGHNDKVFVIDYWGTQQENAIENELKHAVFFKFKDEADPDDVKKVEEAFAELPAKIDTIKAFEWGTNNSPERHSHGFTHCFMVSFDSEEGRAVYIPHAAHQAFVEVLVPVMDKVRVLDYFAQQ